MNLLNILFRRRYGRNGAPHLFVPEESDRRSLGRVTVLVRVGGNGGHAFHAKVERRDGVAKPFREGQHETAEAAVHV